MARPLKDIVEPGWADALEPVAERIAAMGDFLRAEIAAGRTYLPAGPNVLRAFQQPFEDVRVLIVGQDPYPTPGHAVGLSFSVAPEVRPVPGSLDNIFREMHADLGHPRPSNGDLTPWARQGVLLLNRALTTAPRKTAAHRGKGWEEVTEQAIRALVARGKPLVSVLWGRDARNLRPLLGDLPAIESSHPPHVGGPGLLRFAPVQPGQRPPATPGRRARRLAASVTASRVLAVDSGGSGLRVALADVSAPRRPETLASQEPVRTGGSGIDAGHLLEQLLPMARALLDRAGGGGEVSAVAIGAAGMGTLGGQLRAELPAALGESLGVDRLALAADAVTAYAGRWGSGPARWSPRAPV